MSGVSEVEALLPNPALTGADWADCWQAEPVVFFEDARQAANAVVAAFPVWMKPLLALRRIVVAPFGLRHTDAVEGDANSIGFFPVLAEADKHLIVGIDDRHLDFRIVFDMSETGNGRAIALTTLIKRHNILGYAYLALVLPFHRLIIKSAMKKLLARE